MIYKFLNLFLCVASLCQIALCININKGGGTSQGHGGSVLLLNSSQIAEIGPLDSFFYVGCRLGNIKAVNASQLLQFL